MGESHDIVAQIQGQGCGLWLVVDQMVDTGIVAAHGSASQAMLQRNRIQAIHPIMGVRPTPLSSPSAAGIIASASASASSGKPRRWNIC